VYDIAKHELMGAFAFKEGFGTHFVASGIAGFACTLASAPGSFCGLRPFNDLADERENSRRSQGTNDERQDQPVQRVAAMCWASLRQGGPFGVL
jgi:hypothetical protein